MKRLALLLAATLITSGAYAASYQKSSSAAEEKTITLVTHDSFSISKSTLKSFTQKTKIRVRLLLLGDAAVALNQTILTKDQPLGDALYGIDNTFLSRGLSANLFIPYRSPALSTVGEEFKTGEDYRVTPIDYSDVCINFDKNWFADRNLTVPQTWNDLIEKKYKNLLVVENPATSSPGLAFVLATIKHFGDSQWRQYWKRLRKNGVQVTDGWESAYNGVFSAGAGNGDRPLVVSYASSPAAAVYYSDPQLDASPVGTMLDSCFRQTEYVGILRGTKHQAEAKKLVDFMLTRKFQEDIPLQMFVFPVRNDVELPPVFKNFAEVAPDPQAISSSRIEKNREKWIADWTETVLR